MGMPGSVRGHQFGPDALAAAARTMRPSGSLMLYVDAHPLPRLAPSPGHAPSLAEAQAYVRQLTVARRENFHVLTRLVPPRLVDDFCAVYAFCRCADDLADESESPRRATERLGSWEREVVDCFAGRASHPVFVALRATVERRRLPIEPFWRLLSAFAQDQVTTRYESWDELLGYCSRSAAPVGRLVLMLFDEPAATCGEPADATCAALQLVNFWQDVRRDLIERGRIYIPADVAAAHGLDLHALHEVVTNPPHASAPAVVPHFDQSYRATIRTLCDRTSHLFATGHVLLRRVGPEARPVLKLFALGGASVLRAIERMEYRTYLRRPRLGYLRRACLFGRVWLANTAGLA